MEITKTLFWDHCWAFDRPLREHAIGVILQDIDGATVEEMWAKEIFSWKWTRIPELLPPVTLKEIDAYDLKDNPSMDDLIF